MIALDVAARRRNRWELLNEQNYLDRNFVFSLSWIPASAGMTENHAFLMLVTPAKAGVQFEVFKRKGPSTEDV